MLQTIWWHRWPWPIYWWPVSWCHWVQFTRWAFLAKRNLHFRFVRMALFRISDQQRLDSRAGVVRYMDIVWCALLHGIDIAFGRYSSRSVSTFRDTNIYFHYSILRGRKRGWGGVGTLCSRLNFWNAKVAFILTSNCRTYFNYCPFFLLPCGVCLHRQTASHHWSEHRTNRALEVSTLLIFHVWQKLRATCAGVR